MRTAKANTVVDPSLLVMHLMNRAKERLYARRPKNNESAVPVVREGKKHRPITIYNVLGDGSKALAALRNSSSPPAEPLSSQSSPKELLDKFFD